MGSDNHGGPWGGGNPWGGNKGNNSSPPPNIEELFKRGQQRFKKAVPEGEGNGKFGYYFAILIVLALWLSSGIYQVQPEEKGVVLRFGKYSHTTNSGLHYHFPYPFEEVFVPNVMRENRIEIGFRSGGGDVIRSIPQESLMLTGDENIVDVNFTVSWSIKDAPDFLFNMRDPAGTVRIAAESAMREVVGQTPIQSALTEGRSNIEQQTTKTLQTVLDEFGSGIDIRQVNLLKVDPPQQVVDAFNDVQRAKADRERLRNEAEAYRNEILPKARGNAQRILQEAEAHREAAISQATGEASRFLSVYNAYVKAKDVTMKRLYLETMEEVMQKANKVLIDQSGKSSGVLPLLPLNMGQQSSAGEKTK